MRHGRWRRREGGQGEEAGFTMVAVLGCCAILMSVVLGSVAFLSSSTKFSRYEQDSELALAAAESGLNELLGLLRTDPNYLTVEAVAEDNDNATGYCHLDATGGPEEEGDHFRDVCGWPADQEVGTRPVAPGQTRQRYHYAVTAVDPVSQTVSVVSSGMSRQVVRSLAARIAPEATPLYLYWSDYELADPTDYTAYGPNDQYTAPQTTSNGCGYPGLDAAEGDLLYAWRDGAEAKRVYKVAGSQLRECYEPSFRSWDTLSGRVHSNDTIRSDGATFMGQFTTSKRVDGQACDK
ncbi:MAG: hypothetical protein LBO20_04055, partial [Bifidobacteriaceae bacterium]|nr:hypothetical protein [Bifidobacteriaceae bacterium]